MKILGPLLSALVLISCNDFSDDGGHDGEDLIISYSAEIIQGGVPVTVEADIDHAERIISLSPPSQKWIDNIGEVVSSFTSSALSVKVDGVVQQSGVTPNDLTRDITCVFTTVKESRPYTVRLLSPQSTGLPVINIDTEGGAPVTDKENYVAASVRITDYNVQDNNLEPAVAGIRGRGNTTWKYDKKPYRIKFDSKTSLFGLGSAKSWVLLANYLDVTFITNTVAFEVGSRLGLPFTNHANHVELYLNGDYKGSYLLTEQVQVNKHRVDIDEAEDWFLELDTYWDETYKFRSLRLGLPVNIKSPELEDWPSTEAESVKNAIEADFNRLEDALFGEGFPGNGYRDLVDVESVIKYLLANEIVRNAEIIHPKSTFMYKTAGGKYCFGPLWDFDWAFGYNGNGFNYFEKTAQVFYPQPGYDGSFAGYRMFLRFFDDPLFRQQYKEFWNANKGSLQSIGAFIAEKGQYLERSARENSTRWSYYKASYADEIEDMEEWFMKRLASLDKAINAMSD